MAGYLAKQKQLHDTISDMKGLLEIVRLDLGEVITTRLQHRETLNQGERLELNVS